MTTLLWVAVAVGLALYGHYATIVYALYQRREVKVGLKIPFVACFFEAKEHGDKLRKK